MGGNWSKDIMTCGNGSACQTYQTTSHYQQMLNASAANVFFPV